jgi:hypothetical protein
MSPPLIYIRYHLGLEDSGVRRKSGDYFIDLNTIGYHEIETNIIYLKLSPLSLLIIPPNI